MKLTKDLHHKQDFSHPGTLVYFFVIIIHGITLGTRLSIEKLIIGIIIKIIMKILQAESSQEHKVSTQICQLHRNSDIM